MQDWIQKKLSNEWTVYYLPEDKKDIDTWLMEHTVPDCGGTVDCESDPKVCSICSVPVPSKLMTAITSFLKKDLIRV